MAAMGAFVLFQRHVALQFCEWFASQFKIVLYPVSETAAAEQASLPSFRSLRAAQMLYCTAT